MKASWILAASGLLFAVAGTADSPAPPNLHDLMKKVVAVQTQVIWDVTNNATNDDGEPDVARMKAVDWEKLADAAGKVKDAAQKLGNAPHVMAAAPGQKIESEGAPGAFGAKEVQKAIDANPKALQAFAQELAGSMDEILAGVKARQAKPVFEVAGRLDQECEGCHKLFWYPNQQ